MFQQFAIPQADGRLDTMCLHQGGAPRHIIDHVVQFLNETFPDRWLGRCGLIAWPPRSSNLKSFRFFYVCLSNRATRLAQNLKVRKRQALRKTAADMLRKAWIGLVYCSRCVQRHSRRLCCDTSSFVEVLNTVLCRSWKFIVSVVSKRVTGNPVAYSHTHYCTGSGPLRGCA